MADKLLTIDPEFRDLCRALTPEERSLLEASIEADGCRDDIVTWANHDDTILDGHNRYEICTQLDIKFKTTAINLPDRHACIEWIIANQLGKRNLTDEEKSFLRGKRYRAEKKARGGTGANQHKQSAQNEQSATAERLAAEYNTSPATIRRDANFADAVDKIAENVGPDARHSRAVFLRGKRYRAEKKNVGRPENAATDAALQTARPSFRARPCRGRCGRPRRPLPSGRGTRAAAGREAGSVAPRTAGWSELSSDDSCCGSVAPRTLGGTASGRRKRPPWEKESRSARRTWGTARGRAVATNHPRS